MWQLSQLNIYIFLYKHGHLCKNALRVSMQGVLIYKTCLMYNFIVWEMPSCKCEDFSVQQPRDARMRFHIT